MVAVDLFFKTRKSSLCTLSTRLYLLPQPCYENKSHLTLPSQLTYVHNETNVGLQDLINQGHHFIQPLMMLLTFFIFEKWKNSAKTQQDTQKCESSKHWTWTSKPTNMLHFWLDFTDSLICIALVWLYHQPLYLWRDSWFLSSSVEIQGLWSLTLWCPKSPNYVRNFSNHLSQKHHSIFDRKIYSHGLRNHILLWHSSLSIQGEPVILLVLGKSRVNQKLR